MILNGSHLKKTEEKYFCSPGTEKEGIMEDFVSSIHVMTVDELLESLSKKENLCYLDKHRRNVLMICLFYNNFAALDALRGIDSQVKIDYNHIDCNGNSLIHYMVYKSEYISDDLFEWYVNRVGELVVNNSCHSPISLGHCLGISERKMEILMKVNVDKMVEKYEKERDFNKLYVILGSHGVFERFMTGLYERIEELNERLQDADDKLIDQNGVIDSLEAQVESAENRLNAIITEKEKEILEKDANIMSLKENLNRLKGEKENIEESYSRYKGELTQLGEDKKCLSDVVDKLNKDKNGISNEVNKLKEDKVSLLNEINKLEKDRISLLNEINKLEKDKVSLSNEINKLEKDKISLSNEISKLEKDKISLSNEINKLEKDRNRISDEVNISRGDKNGISNEINKLEKDKVSLLNEINKQEYRTRHGDGFSMEMLADEGQRINHGDQSGTGSWSLVKFALPLVSVACGACFLWYRKR